MKTESEIKEMKHNEEKYWVGSKERINTLLNIYSL